jgi:hypothetical protein
MYNFKLSILINNLNLGSYNELDQDPPQILELFEI